MRILFAGSPAIALPCLDTLAELALSGGDFELAGILTNPDSPKGRRGRIEATEVGARAALIAGRFEAVSRSVPAILKPERLAAQERAAVAALKPDMLLSFAYGRIFGPKFLALFPLGGINIHPSLLPKYRGPAPIPAVILNREAETGISIQKLALEMDAGDIILRERFPLSGRETTASLSEYIAQRSAALLPRVLQGILSGELQVTPQRPEEASYCSLISKEEGRIDWSRAAADIDARIRAFNPWPLSWTAHGDQICYILEGQPWAGEGCFPSGKALPGTVLGTDKHAGILIQTGDGVYAVNRLQYQAKKALAWKDFLNGARDFSSARLV
ncbi:MAG: methionyl-tRNA formyltransferase [Treponema sp.]|jgi:methionyl-tRNA formyltransferase|nr:methionyl-tRNA formyltransferase [Treponema sp.]